MRKQIFSITLIALHFFTTAFQHKERIHYELPAIHKGDVIIRHLAYTFEYKEKFEQSDWVAYILTKQMTEGTIKRTNKFIADPNISTGSALPSDYARSGFDKGHLAPAADMGWSEQAMKECFYMSNMSPQEPSFNRGIWKKLEEKVRDFARENDTVYIVTGPVLKSGLECIGDGVAVPECFYKVIVVYKHDEQKGIGFLLANKKSNRILESFAVPIDSVESLTGINFFAAIPDSIQSRIESKYEIEKWFR